MAIKINITKAKDITKDRLRREREPLLEALDIEVMKNLSDDTLLAQIETEKQSLRDAPVQVDSMTTVNELKAASLPPTTFV